MWYTTGMKKLTPPKSDDKPAPEPTPFEKFKALAAKVIQVPKSVVDARESEYQKERAKKARRGPKPGSKGK